MSAPAHHEDARDIPSIDDLVADLRRIGNDGLLKALAGTLQGLDALPAIAEAAKLGRQHRDGKIKQQLGTAINNLGEEPRAQVARDYYGLERTGVPHPNRLEIAARDLGILLRGHPLAPETFRTHHRPVLEKLLAGALLGSAESGGNDDPGSVQAESSMKKTELPRAVILCAVSEEYRVLREFLENRQRTGRHSTYETGRLKTSAGAWDVLIYATDQGNAASAAATDGAIHFFSPHVALFVGVAGGFSERGISHGDLIVATEIHLHQSGAAEQEVRARPRSLPGDHGLCDEAALITYEDGWAAADEGSRPPRVHAGHVVSGEVLLRSMNSETYRFIRQTYNHAIAVEMEGYGFLQAAHQNRVRALVIRGVSDLLDDKNLASDEEWQPLAVRRAILLVVALLARMRKELIRDQVWEPADRTGRAIPSPATLVRSDTFHERLHGMAPGSTRHQLADIVAQDHIYLSIPWRKLGSPHDPSQSDLVEELVEQGTRTAWQTRTLVIAPPGSGKTVLSYRLARRLMAQEQAVVHVDLAQHKAGRAAPDFASGEWIQRVLGVGTRDFRGAGIVLILDSLDEMLSGLPQQKINELLSRELFSQASAVVCRMAYYERYLSASGFSEGFAAKFELAGLPAEEQDALAARYLAAEFGKKAEHLSQCVVEWIEADSTRRSICASPLHLMLAAEAVTPTENRLANITDLVGLWRSHVDAALAHEAQRPAAALDADQKAEALEHIAWHFYDEEGAGNANPPLFTRDELRALLERTRLFGMPAGVVQEDVENRTLLVRGSADAGLPDTEALAFSHRSLHNYFVARHLFRAMCGSGDEPRDAFGKFISGPVSRMLLEFIERLMRNPRAASEASERLIEVIQSQPTNGATDSSTAQLRNARLRIGRQQAAYYLGALRTARARRFLTEAVSIETDLWVARGMAIGLSLSGDDSAMMGQIDKRRAERAGAEATPLCDVNIGYHLSFAGDQPLDIFAPDVDQGYPVCSLAVNTLARQLEIHSKRGSWRSTLFTFVDLARNREISRPSFCEAARRDAERFRAGIDRMARDPEMARWPELTEAQQILDELA